MANIGWIGTGNMGAPMCRRLIEAGHEVTVFNRTKSKAQELLDLGAAWAGSPKEVARGQDFVCSVVGYPEEVREVVFGPAGAIHVMKPGSIYIDFSTSTPSLAVEIAEAMRGIGAGALDAPISGGVAGSRTGTLSIMIGGDEGVLKRALPVLQQLGNNIVYHGPAGSGQHVKVCCQIQVAHNAVGVAESFLYAAKAGLDLEKVHASLLQGAASSWVMSTWGPGIVKRSTTGGVGYWTKDVGIALHEAERLGVPLPVLAVIYQLFVSAKAIGSEKKNTLHLHAALEHMAGLD